MTIQIIRDMGRDVPEDCQDPESEEYYHWLAGTFEAMLNERHSTDERPFKQMAIARGGRIIILNAKRGESGIWQVK